MICSGKALWGVSCNKAGKGSATGVGVPPPSTPWACTQNSQLWPADATAGCEKLCANASHWLNTRATTNNSDCLLFGRITAGVYMGQRHKTQGRRGSSIGRDAEIWPGGPRHGARHGGCGSGPLRCLPHPLLRKRRVGIGFQFSLPNPIVPHPDIPTDTSHGYTELRICKAAERHRKKEEEGRKAAAQECRAG